MSERYIAFDVETPNSRNNRISALGITIVENGRIVDEYYSLIDPETEFDAFNIMLTGIRPEMTENKPNFRTVWEDIGFIMDSGLLIAHNAPFDMSVLAKCIDHYEIDWKRQVDYACTCRMGRRLLPELQDHKLNTLCGYFGIDLDHHNALSDSAACAELLLRYQRLGADVSAFRRHYDLWSRRTLQIR